MRDLYNVTEHGHLLRNILLFGRLLRAVGVKMTPTQILDFVESLNYIDLRNRRDFKNAARTILITKHEHIPIFDRAFDLFWQARDTGTLMEMALGQFLQNPNQAEQEKTIELLPPSQDTNDDDDDDSTDDSEESVVDTVYTYSAREIMRQKDFGQLDQTELQEIKLMMQRMHWKLEQRRTRRKVRSKQGSYIDLRRTFRQNLRYGGQPLELHGNRSNSNAGHWWLFAISAAQWSATRGYCLNLSMPSATALIM